MSTTIPLIGYPGEVEEFPQSTIVRGLPCRVREWESATGPLSSGLSVNGPQPNVYWRPLQHFDANCCRIWLSLHSDTPIG